MKILSVGPMSRMSNTCRLRNTVLEKIADKVDVVNTSCKATLMHKVAYKLFQMGLPINLPDTNKTNKKICRLVKENDYDIVWIDKGLEIYPSTLDFIRKMNSKVKIINFSPDNMMERPWQSRQYLKCIPEYDYHITTKSFIVNKFYRRGAKNVVFVHKTFQPDFHYPRDLSESDKMRLGADVGFVGTWEKERCASIFHLGENGIKVKVFGGGEWRKYVGKHPNVEIIPHGLFDDDYAKSFSAFKISLCFLKKSAKDQQTARSVEIPACGGFMMAERTEEHKSLFKEDEEAVYFSSDEELLDKCRYYLSHDDERRQIALKGRQRCLNDDYTNEGMIRKILLSI